MLYKALLTVARRPAICIIHLPWSKLNWAEPTCYLAVAASTKGPFTFIIALMLTHSPGQAHAEIFRGAALFLRSIAAFFVLREPALRSIYADSRFARGLSRSPIQHVAH